MPNAALRIVVLAGLVGCVGIVAPAFSAETVPLAIHLQLVIVSGEGQDQTIQNVGNHISVRSGRPIELRVTYKNISASKLDLMRCRDWWARDAGGAGSVNSDRILVLKNNSVRVATSQHPGETCNFSLTSLSPGEEADVLIDLSREFNLAQAGDYQVKIRRALDTPKGDLWGTTEAEKDIIHRSAHPKITSNVVSIDVF